MNIERGAQATCSDCPVEKLRIKKTKRLIKAVRHYDYCKNELFGGEPVLSDVEEAMVRGLINQQKAQAGDDELVNIVRLVASVDESAGNDQDFFTRVICWHGMEGQRQMIAALEQEVEALSCDIPC